MKKERKIILALMVALVFVVIGSNSAWAAQCGGVETSVIECSETGSGAIGHIMTIGVGILGVLGITIVGIQYLTAGGSEEKTRKAKRRMFEIILGLAAYALLFGFVQWLGIEPDQNLINNNVTTGKITPRKSVSSTVASVKKSNNGTGANASGTNANTKGTSANGQKIMKKAEEMAGKIEKSGLRYQNSGGIYNWKQAQHAGRIHCAQYVSIVLQEAGLIPKNAVFYLGWNGGAVIEGYDIAKDKDFTVTKLSKAQSVKQLVNSGKLVPGDIVGRGVDGWHTMIYRGKENGKYLFYSVGNYAGGLTKNSIIGNNSAQGTSKQNGSYKIGVIIHPK